MDDLKEIRRTPNEGLIKLLKLVLEKAETGEIQGGIFVHIWDNESTSHGWDVPDKRMTARLIGAMHMLMTDVANFANGVDSRVITNGED